MEGFTSGIDRKCRAVAVYAEHFGLPIGFYWSGKYSCAQKGLAFLSFSVQQKGKSPAAIFSFSFSEAKVKWEGSSQEEGTKLTILLTCLMKSYAVSGPNKGKNNPHLAREKRCKQLPRRRPCWEVFQKDFLLLVSVQLSRPSLSGRWISWDGKSLDQKMSLMPAFVSQMFPHFCCQVCMILPVVSPCSGPGCSACQNSSHPTSSKLTLVNHGHVPLAVFALGWERNE